MATDGKSAQPASWERRRARTDAHGEHDKPPAPDPHEDKTKSYWDGEGLRGGKKIRDGPTTRTRFDLDERASRAGVAVGQM